MILHRFLGTIWIILALYDLFIGLHFLYQYSTPATFWLYMVPNWVVFGKLFLGIAGMMIGTSVFKKHTCRLLLPFAALLFTYITVDLIKMGAEMVQDTGSNFVLLGLTIATIILTSGFEIKELKIFKEKSMILFIVVGLMPYIFHRWLDYYWFHFLH